MFNSPRAKHNVCDDSTHFFNLAPLDLDYMSTNETLPQNKIVCRSRPSPTLPTHPPAKNTPSAYDDRSQQYISDEAREARALVDEDLVYHFAPGLSGNLTHPPRQPPPPPPTTPTLRQTKAPSRRHNKNNSNKIKKEKGGVEDREHTFGASLGTYSLKETQKKPEKRKKKKPCRHAGFVSRNNSMQF